MRRSAILLTLFSLFSMAITSAGAQDLGSQEIVKRHLDSIGNQGLRDGVKTLMAVGVSSFSSKLPSIKGGGKAIVVSTPDNLFFVLGLNSKEYSFEKVGYFDGKVSLPWVTPGSRSPLGAFIADHEKLLSDGLFGGSMSLRWLLLDPTVRKSKLRNTSTRKIDGRKVYSMEYFPSDGGSREVSYRIMFDADTFDHVRTEYRHQINPREDTFGTLGRQAGTLLTMSESFSDFRTVDGLRLPYSYKIEYMTNSNSGVYEYEWGITVAQYYINQKLADDFFTFDEK